MWARNQRNSWHGVDFPYHSNLNIADYYKRYAETLRRRGRQRRAHYGLAPGKKTARRNAG